MRKVKYRAYDKVRKEYLSGGNIFLSIEKGETPEQSKFYLDVLNNANIYKDRFIIEEYAGTTKGGKEVYEGSIISCGGFEGIVKYADGKKSYEHNGEYYPIGLIVEWKGTFWRNDLGFWLNERDVEVIGNIHNRKEG